MKAYSRWDTPSIILEGVLSRDSGHTADRSKGKTKAFLKDSSLNLLVRMATSQAERGNSHDSSLRAEKSPVHGASGPNNPGC